jgi:hydrogenase maturation protein HypF
MVRLRSRVRPADSGLTGIAGEPVAALTGRRLFVRGLVQGVGFRPFVYRLARRHGLAGWVRNASGEVEITVEGPAAHLAAFRRALEAEAPTLARITSVEEAAADASGADDFRILESAAAPDRRQPVAPDVATCAACEAELRDPANRRHRYPFITCTDCGPRFTVIDSMPYDRERTSMRAFSQCDACRQEYTDPGNRRYHSETNSCPACGPRVWLEDADGATLASGDDAIRAAAAALRAGHIIGARGLGGFHLAADATHEPAVRRLRERKHREAKPLAIMARTLDDLRALADVGDLEAALLTARERPIVLLPLRSDTTIAASVAPGLAHVGAMLPYTPLHHLLLEAAGRPLVMTSGNRSDEPIATGLAEARERLAGIADAYLLHDRDIVARYDDSVLRVVRGAPLFLRRARGYAPMPLHLPVAAPVPLLAVGPHLKNTFCLVHGADAYVSQHVGDLDNVETLEHYRAALAAMGRLFRIEPEVVVRDLHPGYLSTRVADELGLARVIPVQHHVAHVAAVLAEYGRTDRVIGVAFDGTGYGTDGNVWGAEIFAADLWTAERLGQLRYAPMPGGDLAARNPWRCALGIASLGGTDAPAFPAAFAGIPPSEREVAQRQIARRLNAPLASSMGRLFDAAAAVLGVRTRARYEGQAPMELEALAGTGPAEPLPFPATFEDGRWHLEPLPLLAALDERRARGDAPAALAARFHEAVAAGTAEVVDRIAEATGLRTVALGGGVFQNARLLASLAGRIERRGLEVLVARALSPNDGAISFGQAALAAAILQGEGGG